MSTYHKSGPFDFQNDTEEDNDYAFDATYATAAAEASQYAAPSDAEQTESDELLKDIASSSSLSVVGATLVFKGELIADEDLLVQGQVHGTIEHNADNLTIGIHGKVRADIRARKILVQGEVKGNMYATERVIVESSARVTGDIYAPSVGLKEGAKFKGSIDMDGPPETTAATAPQSSSAKKKTRRRGSKSSTASDAGKDTISESDVDATLLGTEASEGAEE
jgi:cytoskeletal protein CcmA (bactofilin family)